MIHYYCGRPVICWPGHSSRPGHTLHYYWPLQASLYTTTDTKVILATATAMLPNSLPPTASRSPPLVDLGRTPSPPPVVEIPENAEEERRELMSSLTGMFPDTPREYLEEQVQCI